MRKFATALLIFSAFVSSVPSGAQAMSRDVKRVLIDGGIGILGGTLVGCVAAPFAQDARAIPIGTSVGLYMGLVVGLVTVLVEPGSRQGAQAREKGFSLPPTLGELARRNPSELPKALSPARLEWTLVRY